jgi:hypothetical protein
MRRPRTLATAVGVAVTLVGCIFFTQGTNGYSEQGGDAGLACSSAADCKGDEPLVCCLVTGNAPPASICQVGPCGIQLCGASPECGNGISCVSQVCEDAAVNACGELPGCSPRAADAGIVAPDATPGAG